MTPEQISRFRNLIAQWRTAAADPYSEEQAKPEGEILDECALELETALNLTIAEQQRDLGIMPGQRQLPSAHRDPGDEHVTA